MTTFKTKFITAQGGSLDFKINEWLTDESVKLLKGNKKIIDVKAEVTEMQGWPTALLVIKIGDLEK